MPALVDVTGYVIQRVVGQGVGHGLQFVVGGVEHGSQLVVGQGAGAQLGQLTIVELVAGQPGVGQGVQVVATGVDKAPGM